MDYYPFSQQICHNFYNNGGCIFCGYNLQKRTVSKKPVSIDKQIKHFDCFAQEHLESIKKADRLTIAPNGSWFTQVPKKLRKHIYDFIKENNIGLLKYESRASLFNLNKAEKELRIMYQKIHGSKNIKKTMDWVLVELVRGLFEIQANHMVSFGLEVADDNDLKTLNKNCCLDDYVLASEFVHARDSQVCANILIAPPKVETPISKAFETAKFGAEFMKAEEFLIMPCIPMKGTQAHSDWINGEWNPVSATAGSEIFRIIRKQFPQINVRYQDLRVFSKHGRYGKFKRKPGAWSEQEKLEQRERVREIAKESF